MESNGAVSVLAAHRARTSGNGTKREFGQGHFQVGKPTHCRLPIPSVGFDQAAGVGFIVGDPLVLSPIVWCAKIGGNQEESFGQSWMGFRIGAGQSIDRILGVRNYSRCGQCISK